VIAIIPARLQSTRLPGKVLLEIAGSSILQRVYAKAEAAQVFDEVLVATDSTEVMDHCARHGMNACMTEPTHTTGTDRIAEAAMTRAHDIVINIQGDEPFIEEQNIVALVNLLKRSEVTIGTLCKSIETSDTLFDYNAVKLVKNGKDEVLYFSRQAIPTQRDRPYRDWLSFGKYYKHLGLYGFRRDTLKEIVALPVSALERAEKLEQLRWLENGYKVHCAVVQSESIGIDTPEDLDKARAYYR